MEESAGSGSADTAAAAPVEMTAAATAQVAASAQPAETTRLRVPATRLWEAVEKQTTSAWTGRTRVWYEVRPVDELVITNKRVAVMERGEVVYEMELDPGVLYEAQGSSHQQWEHVIQIPFLGSAESKQHIFRMRKHLRTVGGGCLLAFFMYWFFVVSVLFALAIGGAAHSAVVGLLAFLAMFAGLRVYPRKTILLRPLHAVPGSGSGLITALVRHAAGAGLGWEYEVEIPPQRHAEVLALLEPAAEQMRQIARGGSGYRSPPPAPSDRS